MVEAAQIVLDVPLNYLNAGSNLAIAALAGAKQFELLQHYPANDVFDPVHNTRFFYHGHNSSSCPEEEHGHFHLFAYFPESPVVDTAASFSHLVGLSLDDRGQPLRWFTTNRWVTSEKWRSADELIAVLPRLKWGARGRLAPVGNWLNAMMMLFQEQIIELLKQRDAVLRDRILELGFDVVLEDHKLDVISECNALIPQRVHEFIASNPTE